MPRGKTATAKTVTPKARPSTPVALTDEGPIVRDRRVVSPREANEIDQAARIASNFKDYIPEKHMEYARAVLRDQAAHDDRAAVLDRDKRMAEAQGLEVTREQALQAAALAQAKAELEAGYVDIPKEEWFSLEPEEREEMRDAEKDEREADVHDSVKTDEPKKKTGDKE